MSRDIIAALTHYFAFTVEKITRIRWWSLYMVSWASIHIKSTVWSTCIVKWRFDMVLPSSMCRIPVLHRFRERSDKLRLTRLTRTVWGQRSSSDGVFRQNWTGLSQIFYAFLPWACSYIQSFNPARFLILSTIDRSRRILCVLELT